MLFNDDGGINFVIVIPIIVIIIVSIIMSVYFFKKKPTSPSISNAPNNAPAVILKYPQINDTSNNTWIVSGKPYGNGTYITNQSSFLGEQKACYLFNGIVEQNTGSNKMWHSESFLKNANGEDDKTRGVYDLSSGIYMGNKSLSGISGEWVTLKLPDSIILKSYKISTRDDYPVWSISGDTKWWQVRAPNEFVILGSNDGTTWTIIDDRRGNNKAGNWSSITRTFEISNNNNRYNNYAMIVTKVGNDNMTSAKNTINLQEWELYGYK